VKEEVGAGTQVGFMWSCGIEWNVKVGVWILGL